MLAESEFKTGLQVFVVTISNHRVLKSLELVHRRTMKVVDRTTCLEVVESTIDLVLLYQSLIMKDTHRFVHRPI